jgi:YfiH family protein
MILTQKNGLSFFQFPHLSQFPEIRHGIFTRQGGISPSPFDSLNTALSVGDDVSNVRYNRNQILQTIGNNGRLVFTKQVHGCKINVLSAASDMPLIGDAIITDMSSEYLVIQTADCQPVILYDPEKKIVANIHSGWRGSIGNIIANTVNAMSGHFGCIPRNMLAGIGPSLGPCCAEFINYETEIPQEYRKYKLGSNHFDFWKISTDQLCDAGILHNNIISSHICTKCRTDLFFSYRGEKTTGRFSTVIGKVK